MRWIRASTGNPKENSTPRVHAACGERVGRAGRIRPGQQPRTAPGHRARRPGVFGQRRQRHVQHGDVVGGGVGAGVAGAQQPGQRLPAGDVGTVQETQQRVEPEGLLPGRRGVLLLAVRDRDRRVEVQPQLLGSGPGRRRPPTPRSRAAARAARTAMQMAASIRSSTRHVVGIEATGPNRSCRSPSTRSR